MPKVGERGVTDSDLDGSLLDTNGLPARDSLPGTEYEAYGFVAINKARWPEGQTYPDFIVRYIELDSLGSSPDYVKSWHSRGKEHRAGCMVKVHVVITRVGECVPALKAKRG